MITQLAMIVGILKDCLVLRENEPDDDNKFDGEPDGGESKWREQKEDSAMCQMRIKFFRGNMSRDFY